MRTRRHSYWNRTYPDLSVDSIDRAARVSEPGMRGLLLADWAQAAGDSVYVDLVGMAEDLNDVGHDVSKIAKAIQRAYNMGLEDGRKDK